ncbi:MAG: aquaporin [Actinobacteria bacterium]|nr:aquaporin [Actinomycetota bacterium]
MQERGPAAYVAEFVGTFALVFSIAASVILFAPAQTTTVPGVPAPFQDFAVIGLVHTLALFFLIQTFALISGANFNPAITLSLAAIREIRPVDAAIYIVMQLAGGTLGALFAKALMTGVNPSVHYGAPSINVSRVGTTLGAMGAEGIGTLFLVLAVVAVAVNPTGLKDWSGLVIGGTLGFSVMIIAPLTGGALNPARAFGPAVVGHHFGDLGKWLLVYVLAPGVGGLAAAAGYFWLFIQPGKKGLTGAEPVG